MSRRSAFRRRLKLRRAKVDPSGMDVLLEAAFRIASLGIARAIRTPHPIVRVRPTAWLSVAVVAVAAQVVVVGYVIYSLGRVTFSTWSSDLFLFLWLILLPIALFGIAVLVAVAGWLVGVARRTLAFDSLARVELAVAGIGGLATGGYALASDASSWAVMLTLASAVVLVSSVVPQAWQEARVRYPYIA
ncbi:MAG TPA: hypothetical protein VM345_03150 [Acidimicrobiales bacterium]|nr:hypothetical protein [Acidimicrobiales bacterium]